MECEMLAPFCGGLRVAFCWLLPASLLFCLKGWMCVLCWFCGVGLCVGCGGYMLGVGGI